VPASAPVPQFGLLVTGTGKHPSTLVGINLTWSLGQLTPLCNSPLFDSTVLSRSQEAFMFIHLQGLVVCSVALHNIWAETQLAIFLFYGRSNAPYRTMAERFQHSTETIER
jgi:hypothetical protein